MTVSPMVQVQMDDQMALALFLHAVSNTADMEEPDNGENSSKAGGQGLSLDLTQELLRNPQDTFATYARDDSLAERGINEGDLLLVDKVLKPQHDDVVIISVDGELQCRILDMRESRLITCDEEQSPILLDQQVGLVVEGVVTQSIRPFR